MSTFASYAIHPETGGCVGVLPRRLVRSRSLPPAIIGAADARRERAAEVGRSSRNPAIFKAPASAAPHRPPKAAAPQ